MCKIGVKTCLIGFKNVQIKMLVYKRDPFYCNLTFQISWIVFHFFPENFYFGNKNELVYNMRCLLG